MSDLKIQGEVQISAEGAESALDRVAAKAEQMSGRVSAGADKAGRAVDGIGSGADKSAQQFSRAEGRISDSIKRATQSIEQFGKTASQKLELRISEKGLDAAKFEPALAKLRELEKAQGNVGISAGQMQNALRGVPAQFTDIATSLASGQKPLTVFLQQGGQLKDMFGGAGPAARALGGYVLGLVNPFTVAAAAAGTLALAYHQGSKEADAYRAALILTGNAAGTTADRLADMAGRVSTATGKTKGVASEALAALAGSGSIASASMQSVAEAAVRMASVTGESVGDIVKKFDDLGRTPAASSAKLTEQYRYLTAEIYTQIKALEDQGRTAEAAAIAQRTFADAMTDRAKHVEAGLGSLERAWKGVTGAAKSAWDSMLDIGRPDTIQEKLDKAQAALLRTRHSGKDQSALKQEIEHLQEMQRIQSRSLAVQDQQNQKREAALQFEKDGEKFLTKQQQLETEILRIRNTGLAAGAKEEEIQRRIAIAREKYAEKPKAGSANDAQQIFAAQLAAEKDHSKALVDIIQERTKQRILSEREGVEQILAVQNDGFVRQAEILKAQLSATKDTGDREKIKQQIQALGNAAMLAAEQAATARAKIEAEALKSHQEYMKGIGDETAALLEKAKAAEEENARVGLTAEQLSALTAQRYDETIASKEAQATAIRGNAEREAELALIEEQINALKRLKNAEVARPALQKQREEWQRTADTIERSLTDALLRGFESGKSFAENFRDTLKNMFQTLVLRPVISAVLAPVAGGIASLVPGTAAASQGGTGGGLLNLASTGNSLYNLASGGGLLGGFSAGAASAASELALGASFVGPSASLASGAIGFGASTGLATGSAAGAGALSSIGAALPWVGGALAIASLFGGGGLFGKKAKTPKINFINADIKGWSQFDTPFGKISGAAKHDKNFAATFDSLKPIAEMDKIIAAQLTAAEISAASAAIAGTGTGEIKSKNFSGEDFILDRLDRITDSIGGWINDLADTATGEINKVYGETAGILAARRMDGAETLARELLTYDPSSVNSASARVVSADSALKTARDAEIAAIAEGLGEETLALRKQEVDLATETLAKAKETEAAAQAAFAALGEASKDLFKEGETAAAAFVRMANALGVVNPQLEAINRKFEITARGGNYATDLLGRFASPETFTAQTTAYYQAFYSAADQQAAQMRTLRESVNASFADMGAAVPSTMSAFRNLVESLDLTTDAGQKTFASLMGVSGAFATVMKPLEDAVRQAIADAQKSALGNADAAYSALERAAAKQRTVYQDAIDAATDVIANIDGMLSSLSDAVRTLRGLDQTNDITLAAARRDASSMIDALRTTGALPDEKSLGRVISTLTSDSADRYATKVDFERSQLRSAALLSDISGLLEDEGDRQRTVLDVAEDQLSALDAQLESAKLELDALHGIDTSVKSVTQAMMDLSAAIQLAKSPTPVQQTAGTIDKLYQNILGRTADAGGKDYWTNQVTSGATTLQGVAGALVEAKPINDAVMNAYASLAGKTGSQIDDEGLSYWTGRAYEVGTAAMEKEFEAAVKNIRGYAEGTNYVQSDRMALIHEGERIMPAADNRVLLRLIERGSDEGATAALIEEVRLLRAEVRAVAGHTAKTSRTLERVVPDGDALAVRTAA